MSTGTFRIFFLNTEAGTWRRILPMPCETSSFGAVAATEGANPPPKLRSYWGLLLWKDEKKSRALKEILEFMILSRQVMETIWNSIKIQHSSKRPEAFLVSSYRWFVQMGLAGHSPSPGEQLDHGIHLSVDDIRLQRFLNLLEIMSFVMLLIKRHIKKWHLWNA